MTKKVITIWSNSRLHPCSPYSFLPLPPQRESSLRVNRRVSCIQNFVAMRQNVWKQHIAVVVVSWFPVSRQQISPITGRLTEISDDGLRRPEYQLTSAVRSGKPEVVGIIISFTCIIKNDRSRWHAEALRTSGGIFQWFVDWLIDFM